MRFKMFIFIAFICVYSLFAALNLSNVSNINFGFKQIENVPIFLALTIAFSLGALCVFPFIFIKKKSKNENIPVPVKKSKKELKKEAKEAKASAEKEEFSSKGFIGKEDAAPEESKIQ